jgi:uncharacterized protein YyaL (SSP411 family)
MKIPNVSQARFKTLKRHFFSELSSINDFICIAGMLMRPCLAAGFSVFILMSPLHAESSSVVDTIARPTILWHEWGPDAFRRAQAEDKLIVLDLTAVWCHACHVMDRTTYSNPHIIELLNVNFIAIRVDTDHRPDLTARYRAGGWPTTNLLLPTGEILFQANALEPEEMKQMLLEIQSIYETDKPTLLKQASQFWNRVKEKAEVGIPKEDALRPSLVEQSVEIMRKQFDAVNGGFREAPKFFEPEAIQMAFAYGFFENDSELIQMGLSTLEKQVPLLDPVWGGFYRYAEHADWSQPHFEKMLTIQAQNLRNYVEAFQLTGDPRFRRIALALIEYVSRFLTDPETGLFYESQDADVRRISDGSFISGAEYYSLSESERLAIGIPRVDPRIFTGSNALMAGTYLYSSSVLGKPEMRELAVQVLSQLFEERFDPKRGLAHVESESGLNVYGVLSSHILLGQALVEAFSATGRPQFLQYAEAIAEVSQQLLHDSVNGGFFDHPNMSDTLGLLKVPTKPVIENFQAARWFLTLFHLTGQQEYRAIAERALQAMLTSLDPLPIALTGLAVDQWFRTPVHIAVVGTFGDSKTKDLWLESQRLYCPGKTVKVFDPRTGQAKWGDIIFPYDGRPVAFVCTDRICSAPVFRVEEIKDSIAEILAVLKESVHKEG